MRTFVLLTMFTVALAGAETTDYEEFRELRLDGDGVDKLTIDAGAGSLDIVGVAGADEIYAAAGILVPDSNAEDAREMLESRLELSLDRVDGGALLKAHVDHPFWKSGDDVRVNLLVNVPAETDLEVIDGSGYIELTEVYGAIDIDDGSGSIELSKVGGPVRIIDGSGSISAVVVDGDLAIEDGSGSIRVEHVTGTVTIDDGSGSIDVSEVREDLIIVDDGSGGLKYSAIGGLVDKEG